MSSVESSNPSRWRASLFWLYRSIENTHTTAVHMHSWLIAKILRMMIVCLSRILDVNGVPYLDLRSPFDNASDAIKCVIKLLSCSCGVVPCSAWYVRARAIPCLFLSKSTEIPMTTLNCFAFSVSSFAIAKLVYPIFIVVRHRHEHASSFKITRFSGSQECLILVAVAWTWSACDIILEHSCRWVFESFDAHAWSAVALLFFKHDTKSENTCTSVLNTCPAGDSKRSKIFPRSISTRKRLLACVWCNIGPNTRVNNVHRSCEEEPWLTDKLQHHESW